MATIHVVRHKVLVEGLSQRDVARQLGISRNTVAKYLEHSTPHRVEINPRPQPVQDVITPAVHRLLEAHRGNTTAKQRLTSPRLVELLQEQGIHAAPRTVRRVVAEYKRARREVHVPLHYTPGDLAQVDFFEIALDLQGKRIRAWMFLLRMMYSGRDAAWIYRFQDTTCFLDGHVRAFRHFGGVPHRIVYDNLKPAVQRHLIGSRRLLQPRFAALASHYLFEPVFARPYTGSDKGGVEARGKGIRLQHLTPIPSVDTLEHAGRALQERLDERARTRLRRRGGQPIAARARWRSRGT